ncbi:ABC-type branched-subunit amino acid transport system substrate-binding protein [Bradyrhizobium diazoefficiens]
MRARNYFVGAAFALLAGGMAHSAMAQDIKIGEINSYSLLPAFTEPYRKGWQLAVEEINAAGGINGKKLVVVSKDDGGKPADAQTAANELVSSEGVAMLTGTFLSNIGLAVSDFANQKKVFFLAAEPLTDAVDLVEGQQVHLPPAALELHAGRDAGGSSQQAAGKALGDDRAEL